MKNSMKDRIIDMKGYIDLKTKPLRNLILLRGF